MLTAVSIYAGMKPLICILINKPKTIKIYFEVLIFVIRKAIKDKILTENPVASVSLPKLKKNRIIYLEVDELKLLVKTDCKDAELKRAFIFSCLTGLRWSDVYKLKWSEIEHKGNGKHSIVYRQQKRLEFFNIF